ncbi:MAG: DNA alkylation repair protein [Coprobacter sp.]|nr:DNA alkylation repair protein [Coprobacter sp.]
MTAQQLKEHLFSLADAEKAKILSGFFKTGPGEYGEGDVFIGVSVPMIRSLVKQYKNEILLSDAELLLGDAVHECRLLGLLLMVALFDKADAAGKKEIFESYLSHTQAINNWDLVDLTAYRIVGTYLMDKERSLLYSLSESRNLWEQRISIVSTWIYIRKGEFGDTLRLADILLQHKHDLIQKAVGWMLREIGKRDKKVLIDFLEPRYRNMPRTMLRYAIEKFSPEERAYFMKK